MFPYKSRQFASVNHIFSLERARVVYHYINKIKGEEPHQENYNINNTRSINRLEIFPFYFTSAMRMVAL